MPDIGRHDLAARFPVKDAGQGFREGRRPADGLLHGRAELGRMGGGQADHGDPRFLVEQGGLDPDRRMRIEDVIVFVVKICNSGGDFVLGYGSGREIPADLVEVRRQIDPAVLGEFAHQFPDPLRFLVDEIVKIALEIGGGLDIHGRTGGLHDLAQGIFALVDESGEDVIGVGGQDELADRALRQHPLGDVAGKDIAEIAGRHREGQASVVFMAADMQAAVDVIDHLGQDPGPVDRVDRPEVQGCLELDVAEDLFDDGLAVVEGTMDGDVEDIAVHDRGHLFFLDRADPFIGMEDEDADPLLAADAVDGGAAGVARGRPEDIEDLAAPVQQILEEVAEKLQGDVLEGQGRTVEEFEDMQTAAVHQGRHFFMVKGLVGAVDQSLQVADRDIVDKPGHDLEGQFGVTEVLPG